MTQEREDAKPVPKDAAAPGLAVSNSKEVGSRPTANGFHPIKIKGEPLSETIIRERRERPW